MRKQDDTTEAAAEWLPIESLSPWADNPRSNAHAVPEVAKDHGQEPGPGALE
ncbi:MAG: hypothetical protein QF848_15600 [Planctomycetota bacterium]|nr:hypothetical protein [Planctomycetota bacterium]